MAAATMESRQFHHFAEYGAEQEHGEIQLHEADHFLHEDAGEHRRDGGGLRQKNCGERGERRHQDHAVSAIRGQHEKRQGGEDDDERH